MAPLLAVDTSLMYFSISPRDRAFIRSHASFAAISETTRDLRFEQGEAFQS